MVQSILPPSTSPRPLSRTPTNASTSSFSLISETTSALDALSISTESIDFIMRDISTRGFHSRNGSASSSSARSAQGPISPFAQNQAVGVGSGDEEEEEDDDYEVILVPRSLASSIIGSNISGSSISGNGFGGKEEGDDEEEGKTPNQPLQSLPPLDNRPTSSSGLSSGPVPTKDTAITAEQARFEAKKAKNRARNKAKAEQRKAEAVARAAGIKAEQGTETSSADGSYTGLSSDDVIKIEKGKGKAKGKGKKTKRAGSAAGKRNQNREMGNVEDTLSSTPKKGQASTYPISGTQRVVDRSALNLLTGGRGVPVPIAGPSNTASLQKLHLLDLLNNGGGSVSSRSTTEDDDDDDDTESGDMDEVDNLSELGSGVPEVYRDVKGETPSRRRRRDIKSEGSILSAEDAKSSIDEFLMDPSHAMTRDEKLRFWQSLCFELGLADLEDSPPSLPDLPTSPSPATNRPESPSTSRSVTPTQARPMPQTLFDAKYLLKSEGHVNIADYFEARRNDNDSTGSGIKSEQEQQAGKYAYLVQPSVTSMKKYTKSNGRFVNLSVVKAEAMQPLLRNFGFKLSRERREAREFEEQGY